MLDVQRKCVCWGDGALGGKGREYGGERKGGAGDLYVCLPVRAPSQSAFRLRGVGAKNRGSQNKPKAPRPSDTLREGGREREREKERGGIQAGKRPRMEQQSQRKDTTA